MPGLDPGIHAQPHVSMDHRVKPGGDEVKRNGRGTASGEDKNSPISSLPGLTRQSMLTSGMRTFWVYILASRPRGTLYTGVMNNLIRRIFEHREGLIDGFTKEHAVKMLVYYEQHATAMAAIQREKNIKHWSRSWVDLIRSMKFELARFVEGDRAVTCGSRVLMLSLDHRVKPGGDGLSTRHCAGMLRHQPEHPLPQLQKSAADAL